MIVALRFGKIARCTARHPGGSRASTKATLLRLLFYVVCCGLGTIAAAQSKSATSTTLTIASGTAPVTTISSGTVVTMTAAVKSGQTPLQVGPVLFCDASASVCSDIHQIGTAQLTSSGTASIRFRPGPGSHEYKAIFMGSSGYLGSTSTVGNLAVTGPGPSETYLSESGSAASYALTATVYGTGSAAPGGNVSFANTSNGNAVLGTSVLTAAPAGLNFFNSSTEKTPYDNFRAFALSDFNGDGILDLAVTGVLGNTVEVFLGNGDGTFTAASSSITVTSPSLMATGDFNGDGKVDLAVLSGTNAVDILLGYGDGSFLQTAAGSATVSNAGFLVVADLDGDGNLDLAVTNEASKGVTILLGNGDGTLSQTSTSPATGSTPSALVVGDFNGDGVPDLAASSESSATVTVLLGRGDGTFTPSTVSLAAGSAPGAMAVADFNRDGILDLAVGGNVSGDGLEGFFPPTVTVLKGNGDGTFTQLTPLEFSFYEDDSSPASMAVGDFNGDGVPDLAVAIRSSSGGSELTVVDANGDGTFTVAGEPGLGFFLLSSVATGDFNGDGISDLAATASAPDGVSSEYYVYLTADQSATATVNGITLPVATGTALVEASYAGDSNDKPSISATTSLAAPQGTPTVSVTASANPVSYGTSLVLKATVNGTGLAPTGTVAFYDGIRQLGTSTVSSGLGAYTTNALAAGPHSITAAYEGDSNYLAVTSAVLNLTVTAATPVVTLTLSSSSVTDQQPVNATVTVAGVQGQPTPTGTVTLASGSYTAQATLANGAATFTVGAGSLPDGTDTLMATYSGDTDYAGANAMSTILVSPVLLSGVTPSPIAPGADATATLTLTAGTYSGTLNLTCALTHSPANAQSPTCSVGPTSVTIASGGSATAVLTLNTVAASSALVRPSGLSLRHLGEGGLTLAGLFLFGVRSRRRRLVWLQASLVALVALGTFGCGGSGSSGSHTPVAGTTAGAYTFTVTATDSKNPNINTSQSIVLTVL